MDQFEVQAIGYNSDLIYDFDSFSWGSNVDSTRDLVTEHRRFVAFCPVSGKQKNKTQQGLEIFRQMLCDQIWVTTTGELFPLSHNVVTLHCFVDNTVSNRDMLHSIIIND